MNGARMVMRTVRGTFYCAIDPEFREFAIAGSRSSGRYSRPDEPTLYLSSSVEGVEAAMIAYGADPVLLERGELFPALDAATEGSFWSRVVAHQRR